MSKWIKCSDRMPEDETDVFVAVYGTDILTVEDDSFESLQKAIEDSRKSVRYTTMACYISGDGWYSDGYPMMIAPTYWMPLPDPPKEVNNG